MATVIRRASRSDEATLRALDAAVWSWDVSPAPPRPPDRDFFAESEPDSTLVAIVDGVVAGYVKLAPALDLESNRHVIEVRGLAVDPAMQRRGLGRRLMRAAAEEASRRGARRMTLRVLAPNRAARTLYESCGFEVEGILRGEFMLDGRYVDDVLMALDLGAATREPPDRGADSRRRPSA
jgi:ribosomal protein S18 acetylase RimI-like enzyme